MLSSLRLCSLCRLAQGDRRGHSGHTVPTVVELSTFVSYMEQRWMPASSWGWILQILPRNPSSHLPRGDLFLEVVAGCPPPSSSPSSLPAGPAACQHLELERLAFSRRPQGYFKRNFDPQCSRKSKQPGQFPSLSCLPQPLTKPVSQRKTEAARGKNGLA